MIPNDGSKNLRQAAAEFRRRYYGPRGNPGPPAAMAELAPEVMELVDAVIYGEIYNRPAVNLQTRSLCTIAALTVLGHSPQLIRRHIQGALHIGVSKEQISEIISQMIFYGGMPAAINAFRVAKETFDEAAGPPVERAENSEEGLGWSRPTVAPATGSTRPPREDVSRVSANDEVRTHRDRQQGQSDSGQRRPNRPPNDRSPSVPRSRSQSPRDGRSTGRPAKAGRPGQRSGGHLSSRPPGRGGSGPGRKRNPGKRR